MNKKIIFGNCRLFHSEKNTKDYYILNCLDLDTGNCKTYYLNNASDFTNIADKNYKVGQICTATMTLNEYDRATIQSLNI